MKEKSTKKQHCFLSARFEWYLSPSDNALCVYVFGRKKNRNRKHSFFGNDKTVCFFFREIHQKGFLLLNMVVRMIKRYRRTEYELTNIKINYKPHKIWLKINQKRNFYAFRFQAANTRQPFWFASFILVSENL